MANQSSTLIAVDRNGARGTLDLSVVPPQGANQHLVLIRFSDGGHLYADATAFVEQEPGVYFFPGNFAVLRQRQSDAAVNQTNNQTVAQTDFTQSHSATANVEQTVQTVAAPVVEAQNVNVGDKLVVPILAEQIRVAREQVQTGAVRVHKTVRETVETVDEPVIAEDLHVERVAVNRFVTETPAVRYEGDTMIVPLLEEVIVVEKRLVLREEVRISKSRETVHRPQQITLRREEANVEDVDTNANLNRS